MISSVIEFFEGRVELYADAEMREKAVKTVMASGVPVKIRNDKENGGAFIAVSPSNVKKIASALDKSHIIVYINNVCGFRKLCVLLRKRMGLILGALIFAFTLALSTLFVFDIEISGADTVSEQKIKAELAELGVSEGAFISDIDRAQVAASLLQMHPEYSWAALNLNGTTAILELKEHTEGVAPPQETADILVARADGIIKQMLVYSGKPTVKLGDAVKKGDILICGYISGSGLQYEDEPLLRYDGAKGSVLAEVSEEFSVTVPFVQRYAEYTDKKRIGIRISFLGHSFKLGKTSEKENYEVFWGEEQRVTLFGKIEIPVTVRECFEQKKQEITVQTDAYQAKQQAEKLAYEELAARLGQDKLSASDFIYTESDDGVTVTVRYLCIREIAEPKALE